MPANTKLWVRLKEAAHCGIFKEIAVLMVADAYIRTALTDKADLNEFGPVGDLSLKFSGGGYGPPDRELSRSQQPMIRRTQMLASHSKEIRDEPLCR